ncbi:hypothetical protein [Nocardia sp. CA-290969]|uniref:hypothetical protein n=1 Tax=Nocardia sp. CA-290969 TaxID=3239986 RepID=UPI003D8CAFB3
MSGPIDETVLELLRRSAAGPALDRPVNAVLADMGLGPLPQLPAQIPLPELPPLPALDLSLIAKPITDLADSFGTGQFAGAADRDPSEVFSQISTVLQTVMQLGASAVQTAMALWQGMGATSAANKSTAAQRDGVAIAGQSAGTAAGTAAATTSVFTGATAMAAVVARYLASVVAAGPFLATGAGQVFLLAATTETLAEATLIIAKTRTELGVESTKMMATGEKVPVTNAPTGVDPLQIVSQLIQIVPSVVGAVSTGAQSVAKLQETLNPVKPIADGDRADSAARIGGAGVPAAALAGGGGIVGGGGIAGTPAQPLAPWPGTRAGGNAGASAGSPGSSPASVMSSSASRTVGGALPMGGGLGAAGLPRGSESSTADGTRDHLVNAAHGNEVVGPMDGASLPVVGTAERVSVPLSGDSPDKPLTL